LHSKQDFAVAPQLFEVVIVSLVRRKEMHDHVAEVHHQPAFLRPALHAPFFLEIRFGCFEYALGKRVQHAITGAVAQDEIIGERGDFLDVEEQDVLGFFIFQGFDDLMGKFESFQVSPL
jgi:hypothetical protein